MSSTLSQRTGRLVYRLAWPGLYVYLRFGARTRVLVLAENHILLVQGWLDNGRWGLPGGGLHRSEAVVAGAIREVKEETGVILQPRGCRLLGSEWRSHQGLKFYCHFLATTLPEQTPLTVQPYEIVAAQWFPMNELKGLKLKEEVRRALQLLAKQ